MAFSKENRKGTIYGIIFVAVFAAAATAIAQMAFIKSLGISPLVIGIVLGIFYANTLHNHIPSEWSTGITFSGKKILRFAIVFYGFRITFQQIMDVGMSGFMVSLIMLSTTFILGSYLGMKIFKMDRDTSMLTASGASVCGAAAVLATEPVLKAEGHKTAVAVSMVVLFGTISMFLYPVVFADSFGIFAIWAIISSISVFEILFLFFSLNCAPTSSIISIALSGKNFSLKYFLLSSTAVLCFYQYLG
jgi:uncharacterized integral membrane protein (TIGR00698 family)